VIHRLSRRPAADIATRLASVVSGVEDEFAIAIHLQVEDDAAAVARDLRRPVSDVLVKTAREALVNAAKHAGPCRVSVRLELARAERLVLTVSDHGVGARSFESRSRHGLTSLRELIREQGGQLRVGRGPLGGTRVTASVDIERRAPQPSEQPERVAASR
jgi:signal transduction histidine kinase